MSSRKELPSRNIEPEFTSKPTFVLLLGPSGGGKTALIQNLKAYLPIDYVSPIMDRPLREGEKDKVSVSREEFTKLEADGQFIVVNSLYGNRYGTPKSRINEILNSGRIPILDFPLDMVEKMTEYDEILYKIYILPPTLGTLRQRLNKDKRGNDVSRFEEGKRELLKLIGADFLHPNIDEVVINKSLEQATTRLLALINNRIKGDSTANNKFTS